MHQSSHYKDGNFTAKQIKAMMSLIIGITIGLAAGVIITIISLPADEEIPFPLELMDAEDQVHESGFIDIPVQRIISQNQPTTRKGLVKIKRRLANFRSRNQFYK